MRGARLILLVACLATAILLGCWDNRRQLQRALDEGHVAIAEITGAQYQRTLPFALDGWRPRFVEQDLSVDLKWEGKDGKPRERKKVPITEAFARTIVVGDQVRLLSLPVKVLDDDLAVPAIRPDSTARLASLHTWITVTGYLALIAWVAFVVMTLWKRRHGTAGAGTPGSSSPGLPPRRTIVGVIALAGGAFLAFQARSEARAVDAMASRGTAVRADILEASAASAHHTVRLAWKDGQGAIRHYGPMPVGQAFWRKVTLNGALAIHQTEIRYLEDDPQVRPTIVEDLPEPGWQGRFGSVAGIALMMIGAGCLFSAVRRASR
ncbi:MAG: hypothetical protein NTV97_23620 [Alphaproteobacteria bacterium]|nr:hypothetical protein [Alphaproteobacteria bacterium]